MDKAQVTIHVRDLARILFCSRPTTIGLLQCIGVLKSLNEKGEISQFKYIFLNPPQPFVAASSLRELILKGPISLDAKYAIARCVARGVLAVHSADFVHKSIRPDTVLVFRGHRDENIKAYLVGFERSRPAAAHTSLTGGMIWDRNLYRHPRRQGLKPDLPYSMQHDIYSFGVCLLEIGIWDSLVIPSEPVRPGKLLQIDEQLQMRNQLKVGPS